jgi:hypothetical protein
VMIRLIKHGLKIFLLKTDNPQQSGLSYKLQKSFKLPICKNWSLFGMELASTLHMHLSYQIVFKKETGTKITQGGRGVLTLIR